VRNYKSEKNGIFLPFSLVLAFFGEKKYCQISEIIEKNSPHFHSDYTEGGGQISLPVCK